MLDAELIACAYQQLQAAYVRSRLETLARQYGRIALFGAGQHTRWLLAQLARWRAAGTHGQYPEIVCILDEAPRADRLEGVPVLTPSQFRPDAAPAVVISSDRHTARLANRWKKLGRASVPCLPLYDNLKIIPFDKHGVPPVRAAIRSRPEVVVGDRSHRPRILHLIGNFLVGGSTRLVADLIEGLPQYAHEVITRGLPARPPFIGLTVSQITEHEAELAREYLHRRRPDLVHLHYFGRGDAEWYALMMRLVRAAGIPAIENVNVPITPLRNSAVRELVYVSDYVRRHFPGGPRACVIHPGCDFSLFRARPTRAAATDCIGMVYRLDHDKLDAKSIAPFIAVARQRPQTHCLIVGDGNLRAPFERQVRRAGLAAHFTFTGYVPYAKLPALYRRMTLFVAPVIEESFGQVTPFAMLLVLPGAG